MPPKKTSRRTRKSTSETTDTANRNLGAMYKATVDYHNALAPTRFTIAGLYLAATGFLVGAWFGGPGRYHNLAYWLVPVLGITITLACWFMEIRTYQLLHNLSERGRLIEIEWKIEANLAFFDLMHCQPYDPTIPFTGHRVTRADPLHRFISHSVGLNVIYFAILVFWVLVILMTWM